MKLDIEVPEYVRDECKAILNFALTLDNLETDVAYWTKSDLLCLVVVESIIHQKTINLRNMFRKYDAILGGSNASKTD